MSEELQPMEETSSVALENARVSYQVAVSLWTYQGSLNWNRFNVILTANSIIVAGIGIILPNISHLPAFAVALPIVGLILCLVWTFLTARGYVYHKYWSSRAREVEEGYLRGAIGIVSEGRSSRKGGKLRFGLLARLGGQNEMSYFVIAVFAFVFVLALRSILTLL